MYYYGTGVSYTRKWGWLKIMLYAICYMIFMYLAATTLLTFCCVALFNVRNAIQQKNYFLILANARTGKVPTPLNLGGIALNVNPSCGNK